MSNNHKTIVSVGSNAKVNSIYLDNPSTQWEPVVLIEFESKLGSMGERNYVTTELKLTIRQARELLNAISAGLEAQSKLLFDESAYLERDDMGLEVEA